MKTAPKKYRVFFALMPEGEIASHLFALAHHVVPAKGSRITPAHNLHMTLAFVGPVTSAQVDALTACAQKVGEKFRAWLRETRQAAQIQKKSDARAMDGTAMDDLPVRLERLGFWPQGGVVWAGTRLPFLMKGTGGVSCWAMNPATGTRIFSDSLTLYKALREGALPWVLADQLQHALAAEGLIANVSLAAFVPHVTLARGVRCASLPRLGAPLKWSAHEFVLLESVTQGIRLTYQPLAAFSLTDEGLAEAGGDGLEDADGCC
ncbi:MAG: RNA 2',3'-cyclic 3'-phosphodiesterase [Rugosibacter sp.]|nr:RNA 2',3'-cyclic 3'-phosphodiesterase [Rugosibacter sp.]